MLHRINFSLDPVHTHIHAQKRRYLLLLACSAFLVMGLRSDIEKSCSSYAAGPPWRFRGRAMYQLHLVKTDVARKLIPSELKLVQAFGYTLGGLFLAHYDDSPAGRFDELVVIAGTVWNPPTSCAWATRVLVSSIDARDHGRKEIGLPSHLASFTQVKSQIIEEDSRNRTRSKSSFLDTWLERAGKRPPPRQAKQNFQVEIFEVNDFSRKPFCNINKLVDLVEEKPRATWKTPLINLSLPSFSGRTVYQPKLLKYSCNMDCRIRIMKPAKVMAPSWSNCNSSQGNEVPHSDASTPNLVMSVLLSKPIFAVMFDNMKIHVKAPTLVAAAAVDTHNKLSDTGHGHDKKQDLSLNSRRSRTLSSRI